MKRILIIRHGALGDIVLSFPAFAAIRAAHQAAAISLLTTAPFADFLAAAPWFDQIFIDRKPRIFNLPGLWRLRQTLIGFDFIYDLQTSQRSSRYFRLAGRPPWSGIAPGCSAPHTNPARNALHTTERLAEQLAEAGFTRPMPIPDLTWLRTAPLPDGPDLPAHFTALIPGAAPHRPEKRWPASHFARLALQLSGPIVILGGTAEAPLAAEIRRRAPDAIDLTGRTSLLSLARVLSRATLAIGNDTGPMHLATALGVPSIVLFANASDPSLTAPRYPNGDWPRVLRTPDLADLPVDRVAAALRGRHNLPTLTF
jgi:ADP-heptose:LPS heptosyltransferase